MKIVEVKVYPFKNQDGPAKAFVQIGFSFNDTKDVHMIWKSCKVMEGSKGLFVAMPSYPDERAPKGYAYPIFIDFRTEMGGKFSDYVNATVLEEFEKVAGTPPSQPQLSADDDDDIPF